MKTTGGISLLGATFLILLCFKLAGKLDASWWIVTAPIWAPTAIVVALFVMLVVVVILASVAGYELKKVR